MHGTKYKNQIKFQNGIITIKYKQAQRVTKIRCALINFRGQHLKSQKEKNYYALSMN